MLKRIKCEKHPKYNGESSPKASCVDCAAIREMYLVWITRGRSG